MPKVSDFNWWRINKGLIDDYIGLIYYNVTTVLKVSSDH